MARRAPFATLLVALLVGALALLLALNTVSAANELRRHGLAVRDSGVAADVQQLRNEVAASAAPLNLQQAAAAIGMVHANHPAFLVLDPDGTVRVAGDPGAAHAAVIAAPTKKKASATKSAGATATSTATSTAASTATSTATASSAARSTVTATGTTSGGTTSPGASAVRHGTATPSASAVPTHTTSSPTPTPTVTLPGGER